jgi:hypothetical protein
MRDVAFVAWLILRIVRWASWVGFLAYSFATTLDRPSYLNSFGQPLPSTEAWLFALAGAALAAGLFELMMREKAGIARPDYFHLMPPSPPHSN